MLNDDQTNEEVETGAAPAELPLPEAVEAVIAAWWSKTVEGIGPMVSTPAYNALGVAHANLRKQLAAALRQETR